MKVTIVTTKHGGPLSWARALRASLVAVTPWSATIINSLGGLGRASLYPPDLWHSTLPIVYPTRNRPVLLTIHGDYTQEGKLRAVLYRQSARRVGAITVPSLYLKDALSLSRAVVIPNAVNMPADTHPRPHLKEEALRFVTIANFDFYQKAQGVVELVEYLIKAGLPSTWRLRILGDGKYSSMVRGRVRSLSTQKGFVELCGRQSIDEHLRWADAFLYNSYLDNMPIALLEAMSYELPIITNDIGAVREMIVSKRDGLVASTPDEFVHAIQEFHEHPGIFREYGQHAKERAQTEFSWTTIIKKYITLYEALAD